MTWLKKLRLGGNSGVLIVFIVLVLVGFGLIRPAYLTGSNLSNILVQATPVAIAAIGMTYVILLADIDLSIGSTMYLSVVVATMLTSSSSALMITPSVWVYPVAIVTGLILGSVNAALISVLRINALIVTLGTLYAYQGIGLALTGAGTQLTSGPITWLGTAKTGGTYVVVLLTIAASILAAAFLRFRTNGRLLYAIGSDPRSAKESGLSRPRARFVAFGLAGVCSAVAGLINVGQDGTLDATLGSDFAFTVITAVVVGGTSLFGGRGTVLGSMLGALLLAAIENGLNVINASIYVYDVVQGVVLVAAILFGAASQKAGFRAAAGKLFRTRQTLEKGA
jgi:ribose transport system permease protein